MKNQIIELRKALKLSQEKFAERIGLTKNFISLIETGERLPSDRTLLSICREFDVNETWLRTGEGPMFKEKTIDEELAEFFAEVALDEGAKKRFVTILSRLNDEQWELLNEILDAIVEETLAARKEEDDAENK